MPTTPTRWRSRGTTPARSSRARSTCTGSTWPARAAPRCSRCASSRAAISAASSPSPGPTSTWPGAWTTSCATPPDLPDIEICRSAQPADRPAPLDGRLDIQYPPGNCWWEGENAGTGRYECWLSHADGADADALSLLLFMDAIPPAVFSLVQRPGWVPTVALSLQVRARPAPGPVRMRVQTQSVGRGLVEEDTEVWDSDDRLVGLSRQLLKLRHVQ